MWWFSEFNGTRLPAGNFLTDIPRNFASHRVQPTGAEGDYDLDGVRNPLVQQGYSYEFTLKRCDFQAQFDALLGAAGSSGILKKTNGYDVRFTTAKVGNVTDATGIADWRAQAQRIAFRYSVEPYWYNDMLTTVAFTNSSAVLVTNTGNARARRYFTVGVELPPPVAQFKYNQKKFNQGYYQSPYAPSLDGIIISVESRKLGLKRYNSTKFNQGYYQSAGPNREDNRINHPSPWNGVLTINPGPARVTDSLGDRYAYTITPCTQPGLLWLEPGENVIHFSAPVTGAITYRDVWI